VLPVGAATNDKVLAYVGSDTMPTCDPGLCWYLLPTPYLITQQQLDFFKVKGVASNYRQQDLSTNELSYSRTLLNTGLFAK